MVLWQLPAPVGDVLGKHAHAQSPSSTALGKPDQSTANGRLLCMHGVLLWWTAMSVSTRCAQVVTRVSLAVHLIGQQHIVVRVHRALHWDRGAVRCARPVVVVARQVGKPSCGN